MHIPAELFKYLRVILAACLVLAGVFIYLMWRDTRPREYYTQVTGVVTYLDKRYGTRTDEALMYKGDAEGKYRFLELTTLPYTVEIYADDQAKRIDSLRVGDQITLWYILSNDESWPGGKGVNPRFIYKGNKPVYIKDGHTSVVLGEVMLFVLFLLCFFSIVMYRRGKIKW